MAKLLGRSAVLGLLMIADQQGYAQTPVRWEITPWVKLALGAGRVAARRDSESAVGAGLFGTVGAGVYLRPELSLGVEATGHALFLEGETVVRFLMLSAQLTPFGGPLAVRAGVGRGTYADGGSTLVGGRLTGQLGLEFDPSRLPTLTRRPDAESRRARPPLQVTMFVDAFESVRGRRRGPSASDPYTIVAAHIGASLRIGLFGGGS